MTGPGAGRSQDRDGHGGIVVDVRLAVPPAAVWAHLERIEDHVTWMRDAEAIDFTGDRRRGTGTTFTCATRVGPIRLTDRMEITDWEPLHRMGVVHRGAVSGAGRFLLEPDGDGSRLTWSEQLRFPWWLGGAVGRFLARPVLRALWAGNLRRLRRLVEAGPPATNP